MSRLWRSELRLGLRPSGADPSWAPAVEALRPLLKPHDELAIVISSHFARYAVLPWSKELRTRRDWQAYAQHVFASTHGAAARDWRVGVCPTGGRQPWIASAVDRALIDALSSAAAAAGARLASVQPHFVSAFNRTRLPARITDAWIVAREAGRLTFASVVNGAWNAIRSRRAGAEWQAELKDWIEREALANGADLKSAPVYMCAQET